MKGYRYKGKGWHGESHRHYLAAKGIKTGRKSSFTSKNYFAKKNGRTDEEKKEDFDACVKHETKDQKKLDKSEIPKELRGKSAKERAKIICKETVGDPKTGEGRPVKSKKELKKDTIEWIKLQFHPREIILPSEKNEQKTAEFIYDVGKSVKTALKGKKK